MSSMEEIKSFIANVPDFPKPGILFRDISPLLAAPEAFRKVVAAMTERVVAAKAESLVAVESRGFLFAAPVAHEAQIPLVLVRKPGKLPGALERVEYGLEYGSDVLEMKSGALASGSRVVVVDDVLATGGTARAASELVQKVGAQVSGYLFLIELLGLQGRSKLEDARVEALVNY